MSGDLYIFNPEHDLCLANGDMNFIPPFSALRFARDCAGLTEWVDGSPGSCEGGPVRRIIPWGWDTVLRRRLQRRGIPDSLLPSDECLSEIRRLSHRKVAVEAGKYIVGAVGSPEYCPGRPVLAISDPSEIAPAVDALGEVVLKAPWSGSGKGLRYTRRGELSEADMGWCRRVIARQGCVMAERRERVVQDFAMLFSISESVTFEGYSLFWNDGGAYRGNVLAGDGWIRSRLSRMIPAEVLDRTLVAVTEWLTEHFVGHYRGYVGADMFVYAGGSADGDAGRAACAASGAAARGVEASGGAAGEPSAEPSTKPSVGPPPARHCLLAPCVELNVRMTMGLLARRLTDRHLPRASFPDGKYVLTVEYYPEPEQLRQRMSEAVKVLSPLSRESCYGVGIFAAGDCAGV